MVQDCVTECAQLRSSMAVRSIEALEYASILEYTMPMLLYDAAKNG